MRRLAFVGLFLLVLANGGCKRQLKLEATLNGFKPGAPDTVLVHIKSERSAEITCDADLGANCMRATVPFNGEMDLEVMTSSGKTKVVINGVLGKKKNQVIVELGALPPTISVNSYGMISCMPRDCGGVGIDLFPKPELDFTAPAGTVVEFGSEKFTVGSDGRLSTPLKLDISPPLEKQPLSAICIGLVSGSTKPPALLSTTLTLTFPDGVKATSQVEITAESAQRHLSQALKEITNGPVLFPWEKPGATAAKGKKAGIYVDGDHCYDGGAAGAVLADLDVIALSEDKERVGECTYELSSVKTGENRGIASGKITMYDSHATVYDRFSGKKLATKAFLAPKNCTKDIRLSSINSRIQDQTSYANEDQIAAWAAVFGK